jgi:hypothetical protein
MTRIADHLFAAPIRTAFAKQPAELDKPASHGPTGRNPPNQWMTRPSSGRRGAAKGVACAPMTGRCIHERRLIRSMEANTATSLGLRRAATRRVHPDAENNPSRGHSQNQCRCVPSGHCSDYQGSDLTGRRRSLRAVVLLLKALRLCGFGFVRRNVCTTFLKFGVFRRIGGFPHGVLQRIRF